MAGLSRQALIIVVSCTVLLSLSTLATVLRFVGIRILRRSIKHHDYFCIVAAVGHRSLFRLPYILHSTEFGQL